jgi:trehalose/maltose hydrolase-like predicted phosphorylase
MFPWESALTGEETCPTWAATGLREIHINGDIAVAVWAMWRSLGGDNGGLFLNATAWPLLSGIADFWMSKLALDNPGAPPGAPLSLLNVIPPDEYVDHVSNSAFTNHGAIQTLRYAAAVAALMGQPPARSAPWVDAAARIVRPHNASGPEGGWTPEYVRLYAAARMPHAPKRGLLRVSPFIPPTPLSPFPLCRTATSWGRRSSRRT